MSKEAHKFDDKGQTFKECVLETALATIAEGNFNHIRHYCLDESQPEPSTFDKDIEESKRIETEILVGIRDYTEDETETKKEPMSDRIFVQNKYYKIINTTQLTEKTMGAWHSITVQNDQKSKFMVIVEDPNQEPEQVDIDEFISRMDIKPNIHNPDCRTCYRQGLREGYEKGQQAKPAAPNDEEYDALVQMYKELSEKYVALVVQRRGK